MIYCGSGSGLGKVFVPVPDPDNIFHSYSFLYKSFAFPIVRNSFVSKKVGLSFLIFYLCWFSELIHVPVPLR
jgi:hypothetical protein